MTRQSPSVRWHEEPDDLRGETCPECDGKGHHRTGAVTIIGCLVCLGTGRVDSERLAEDRAEAAADDRWEASRGN